MKIGILSDIHGNLPALRAVMEHLESEEVDKVLCAGDIIGYYPYPNEVVSIAKNFDCILGNHESKLLGDIDERFNIDAERSISWTDRNITSENKKYLSGLNPTYRRLLDGIDIFMAHGSPQNPLDEYIREDLVDEELFSGLNEIPDVIILGHTHNQFKKDLRGCLIVNPGSVGQPRDGNPEAAFAILDTESLNIELRRTSYDIDEVAEKTKKLLSKNLAERLYRGK